jgi:hypothetical protein
VLTYLSKYLREQDILYKKRVLQVLVTTELSHMATTSTLAPAIGGVSVVSVFAISFIVYLADPSPFP